VVSQVRAGFGRSTRPVPRLPVIPLPGVLAMECYDEALCGVNQVSDHAEIGVRL
jgi:hypothetical protein